MRVTVGNTLAAGKAVRMRRPRMRMAGACVRMPIYRVGVRRSRMIMPKDMTVRASNMGMRINRVRMRRSRMMVLHGVAVRRAFASIRHTVAAVIAGVAGISAGVSAMSGNRAACRCLGGNDALFCRSCRSATSRAGSFASSTG